MKKGENKRALVADLNTDIEELVSGHVRVRKRLHQSPGCVGAGTD